MPISVDPHKVAELIRDVAAEKILPRYQALQASEIDQKPGGELVTIADEEAEQALSEGLRRLLPGSVVVGEEGVAKDPRHIELIGGEDPVWIIDPVDGTINFANGREPFVTIIALAHRGETIMGWIYEPRQGRLAMAEIGGGAWMDGAPLSVSAARPLPEMSGFISLNLFPENLQDRAQALGAKLRDCQNLYSIGAEYLALAAGQVDMAATGRLFAWDHAAGVLLHREAGGYGQLFDGQRYAPTVREGVMILAPDKPSCEEIAALF